MAKTNEKHGLRVISSASRPSAADELKSLQAKVKRLSTDHGARRQLLIDAGIYTEAGKLRKAFGG